MKADSQRLGCHWNTKQETLSLPSDRWIACNFSKYIRSFSQTAGKLPVRFVVWQSKGISYGTQKLKPSQHKWREFKSRNLLKESLQPRPLQSNSAPKLNKESGVGGKKRAAHPIPAKMTTLLQKKHSCQLPKSKWTDSEDMAQPKLLGWGSHRYSPVKCLTLSGSLCNEEKKHSTNEWETGNWLNPCLATLMSACKQRLSTREPLSAVTVQLRDAFFFWLASLLLVSSLITGAGRMKALPDTVDSLQTRRWKQFISSHSWEKYYKAKNNANSLLTICSQSSITPRESACASLSSAGTRNLADRRTEGPEDH